MKILLISHAAWRGTGYGAPVIPLVKQWRKHGHDAAVLAIEERGPGMLEYQGVTHYLPAGDRYGQDVAGAVAKHCGADVIVSLFDAWVLSPRGFGLTGRPWIAWTPVDQNPPQAGLVERLKSATLALSFSEWGADVLRRAAPENLRVEAMPYGVDLDTFAPNDKARAAMREALGLTESAFVVGMVATNMHHDRKALRENIAGFAAFAERHPGVYLILWVPPTGEVDLRAYIGQLGDAGDQIRLVSDWDLAYGGRPGDMAEFYATLDTLLAASAAEGFGIPIVEAMACGVPVIGAASSSMPELITERVGWIVKDTRPEWSWLSGWWQRPTAAGICQALEQARADILAIGRPHPYRSDCIGRARAFGWDLVGERWADTLDLLAVRA